MPHEGKIISEEDLQIVVGIHARNEGGEWRYQMTLALYYSTTSIDAKRILSRGFEDLRSAFMTDSELHGVRLFDRLREADDGRVRECHISVQFCDEAALQEFEVIEEGRPYRKWVVPASFIRDNASVALFETMTSR